MFLGNAFGRLASRQPFELGRFDQVGQGLPDSQLFRPQLAEAFHALVLDHQSFLGVPLDHFLDSGVLLGLFDALTFLVPGPSPGQPVPTLGPAAYGAGCPGLAPAGRVLSFLV
jgi:hypothetical protein